MEVVGAHMRLVAELLTCFVHRSNVFDLPESIHYNFQDELNAGMSPDGRKMRTLIKELKTVTQSQLFGRSCGCLVERRSLLALTNDKADSSGYRTHCLSSVQWNTKEIS